MNYFKYDVQYEMKKVLSMQRDNLKDAQRAFQYINQTLINEGYTFKYGEQLKDGYSDNEKSNWFETKNYKYIALEGSEFDLVIRWFYRGHITMFFNGKPDFFRSSLAFAQCTTNEELKVNVLGDGDIDDLELLNPVIYKVIEKFTEGNFFNLWTCAKENYLDACLIFKKENILDFKQFQFCLEEISYMQLEVLRQITFIRFCEEREGARFKIPTYGNTDEFLIGFERDEKTNELFFKKQKKDGSIGRESLDSPIHFNFDRVYTVLSCLDLSNNID